MHAGGHAAGGMSMMPIMLPDGRIRYVLQQPGLAAMPQPPPRPSPPYRGGSGSSSSKQSSDNDFRIRETCSISSQVNLRRH